MAISVLDIFFNLLFFSMLTSLLWNLLKFSDQGASPDMQFYVTPDGEPPNNGAPPEWEAPSPPPSPRIILPAAAPLYRPYPQIYTTPAPETLPVPPVTAVSMLPPYYINRISVPPLQHPVEPSPAEIVPIQFHARTNPQTYTPTITAVPDGIPMLPLPTTAKIHVLFPGTPSPWRHPARAFDFHPHRVSPFITMSELIRALRALFHDNEIDGVVEVIQLENDAWEQGARFQMGDARTEWRRLEDVGWAQRNNNGREEPVWILPLRRT